MGPGFLGWFLAGKNQPKKTGPIGWAERIKNGKVPK